MADVFYTLPVARLPDDIASLRSNQIRMDRESSAAVLYGAMFASPRRFANGVVELGYFGFRERDAVGRPTRDRDLTTVDLRFVREPAPRTWDLDVEAALQYGDARTRLAVAAPLRNVSAAFYHL